MRCRNSALAVASFIIVMLFGSPFARAADSAARAVQTVPGMPPVIDPTNLYSETRSENLSAAVAKHLHRVYVPNRTSNDVWVIDPATLKVIDKFKVGIHPQHVVPSWDL